MAGAIDFQVMYRALKRRSRAEVEAVERQAFDVVAGLARRIDALSQEVEWDRGAAEVVLDVAGRVLKELDEGVVGEAAGAGPVGGHGVRFDGMVLNGP